MGTWELLMLIIGALMLGTLIGAFMVLAWEEQYEKLDGTAKSDNIESDIQNYMEVMNHEDD